ncbi:Hypothetical protein FKW44_002107 [Caligus rogercresseyi]|uniref:Uncharacterized protein n=1 Tax=Caligus rogercresseyi TaxID=217165 RepID=A0A7T8KJR6_CALRO|nr:Hypothetical protein FKW44_002107 [Caligus rogercresseyi]
MACIGSLLTQSIKTCFLAENEEDFSKKSSYSTMRLRNTQNVITSGSTSRSRTAPTFLSFHHQRAGPLHRPPI